jgi:hypothetical protein
MRSSVLVPMLAMALVPRDVLAQACCAGATTISPARLALHEDGLVGLQIRSSAAIGSFDRGATFIGQPASTGEVDLEEDLVAAVRVFSKAQLAVLLPVMQTWRRVPGQSALGGGFGDLNLSIRYDALLPGEMRSVPGIALLAGITIPTGTPPDRTSSTLATDSTGIGAVQVTGGFALEDLYLSHVLVNLTLLATQRLARSVDGIRETLGLQISGALAAGWVFDGGAGLALIGRYDTEADARVNDQLVPSSGKRAVSFGVVGGLPIAKGWRLQGSLLDIPPISGLGLNQSANLGFSAAVLWTWM